jgi:hypothetical protein
MTRYQIAVRAQEKRILQLPWIKVRKDGTHYVVPKQSRPKLTKKERHEWGFWAINGGPKPRGAFYV